MKKTLKITWLFLLVLVIVFVCYMIYVRIQIHRGNIIKWGDQWYTKGQLEKILPPQEYNVEAKNTPEEAYSTFRQALLDNDLEKALGQITEQKRDLYRQAFTDKEKLNEWVKKLPAEVNNLKIDNNFAYYDWKKNDGLKHSIDFLKNIDGYWEIDEI